MPKVKPKFKNFGEGAVAKRLKVLARNDQRDFDDVNADVGGTQAKNSLDSDEEDCDSDGPVENPDDVEDSEDDEDGEEGGDGSKSRSSKRYDVGRRDDDDSGAEEAATLDFDGDIQITPFNMREEMEAGHFDAAGTYHERKDGDLRDNWLENIDWARVKKTEGDEKKEGAGDEDEEMPAKFDEVACYNAMVELMEPGESVSQALKRLGGKKAKKKPISSLERLRRKKLGLPLDDDDPDAEANRAKVIKLTGLADSALTNLGFMDVYDETHESLKFRVKKATGTSAVDSFDMFSDAPAVPSQAESTSKGVSFSGDTKDGSSKEVTEVKDVDESAQWFYKLDSNPEEVKGPVKNAEMMELLGNGTLSADEVSVRKADKEDGPWYRAGRVDFDLYE